MINIGIKRDTLLVNSKKVTFENVIGGVFLTNDIIIIHLFKSENNRTNMSEQTKNNIYAVDYDGNVIWNIKEIVDDECWVDVIINEKNELIAWNFNGGRFNIDPKLKKVITFKYTK